LRQSAGLDLYVAGDLRLWLGRKGLRMPTDEWQYARRHRHRGHEEWKNTVCHASML
jgi:hypothetical protein